MAEFSALSCDDVNRMRQGDFVAAFGDVAEHSPWVAEAAAHWRPFPDREALIDAFHRAIRDAGRDDQLALIRAHPDLAGRLAIAGELEEDSRREQAAAGLDRLSAGEFARFTYCNDDYRSRFGFPFIYAVRGANKCQVLEAFEARLKSDPAEEFETAIEQILRIVRFRLEDRVRP